MKNKTNSIKFVLEECMEDLEKRIDIEIEENLRNQWLDFYEGRFNGDMFRPKRIKSLPSEVKWPDVRINETLDDFDKMALQQFRTCSIQIEEGSGDILCVRSNYGSSIMMSLFGAEMFYMEDKYNTLPTSKPISGGVDTIRTIVRQGTPDLYGGLGEKVFAMGKYLMELKKNYPKINKYIQIYHPDLQGPMDICEVLWGSNLFIDIVDMPELVKDFLELITETYIKFMKEWFEIAPVDGGYSAHWSMLLKGKIMLRDDSAMNFSPSMFEEFIKPYDQKILDEFGGGAVHFCGRGDHYIRYISQMRGLNAIHISQPHYNDMEIIYQNTTDIGIKLIGLNMDAAQKAIIAGRILNANVHCR